MQKKYDNKNWQKIPWPIKKTIVQMRNKHVMQWDIIQYKWVRYRCEFILREFEHSKFAQYAMLTSVHKSLQCAVHSAMHNQHWSFGICTMLKRMVQKNHSSLWVRLAVCDRIDTFVTHDSFVILSFFRSSTYWQSNAFHRCL